MKWWLFLAMSFPILKRISNNMNLTFGGVGGGGWVWIFWFNSTTMVGMMGQRDNGMLVMQNNCKIITTLLKTVLFIHVARAPVQNHTWVATSPISTAAAGLWIACENRICPEVFMQIVQHERGLCVKSFHVFWQTCVFPDFSDWSPPPLDRYQSSEAKETSSCCHEDYVCGEVYELLLQLGFCLKKKKKKKKKSNFHSDLWEKQINRLGMEFMQVSMWESPKLHTLAPWCLRSHFS